MGRVGSPREILFSRVSPPLPLVLVEDMASIKGGKASSADELRSPLPTWAWAKAGARISVPNPRSEDSALAEFEDKLKSNPRSKACIPGAKRPARRSEERR